MKLPSPKALNADVALHYFLNGGAPQLLYHKDIPIKGSNSCLEFLFAMNRFILVLCVDFARLEGRLSLNFKTCLAMFSLCLYGHGFHLQSGVVPNLPFNDMHSSFDTFAKLEK